MANPWNSVTTLTSAAFGFEAPIDGTRVDFSAAAMMSFSGVSALISITPGLTPVKFDLNLHHGVMIQGRVTNRVTGAAVEGAWMHFIPWPDNPNLKGMTEYGGGSMHGSQTRYQTDHVGRFRVVGLPGRGLVEISHVTGPFPSGQGFGDIKGLPDAQQFLMVAGALFPSADTTPAVRETQIRDADAQVQVDFELEPGKQARQRVVVG